MAAHDRPSGLSALAVIAFILTTLNCLGGVATFFAPEMDPSAPIGLRVRMILAGSQLVTGLLLGVTGIGLLRQKRWSGRWTANLYALTAIGSSLYIAIELPARHGGDFNFTFVQNLFFPLFVLVLVNSIFRHDLVR